MATKQTAVTETPAATPLVEIAKRPDSITLFGPANLVLDEYAVHARNGYRLLPDALIHYFPNGSMSITLCLGEPLALAVQRAKESVAREQAAETARFERRVTEEAARRVAANAQAELDQRIAAAEAVANAAVEKIRADAAAERARIEASL